MPPHAENETWIVEAGAAVIEKKSLVGADALSPLEQLIYCLWVADYGMRNAGDFVTARDLYSPFQHEAAALAEHLKLGFVQESFSLPTALLAQQYFDRFDRICEEIKSCPLANQ
jgi:hypothetical protein